MSLLVVLLAGCEEDVAEVLGTGRAFTLYRVFTSQLDTQRVRVYAIENQRLTPTRPEEALRAYRAAQYLDPNNPEIRLEVGNLSLRYGALEEAIHQYQAALQIDSAIVAAWLNLGIAQARAGHEDEARRAWNKVLALSPDHPSVRSYLARLDAAS